MPRLPIRSLLLMRVLGAALLLAALPARSAGADTPVAGFAPPAQLTVVSDVNYPPYLFQSDDGKLHGILVDKWALWSRVTGVPVTVVGMDWARAQESVHNGTHDVIETLAYTASRAKLYEFSRPYSPIEARVYFNRTISGISNDVSTLRGFTIGAKEGSACGSWLAERGVRVAQSFATSEALVRAAGAGKLQLFCMDAPAAQYFLYKHWLAEEFRQTEPLYVTQFHWAAGKGRAALRDFIQQGFDRIAPKEISAIENGWLGNPLGFPIATRYLYYFAILVFTTLFAGAVVLLWNRALRLRVAARTADLRAALDDVRNQEAHLRERGAQVQAFLRHSPVVYIRCDPDGRISAATDRWKALFLEPGIEAEGRDLGSFLPPEAARACRTYFEEAVREGKSVILEHELPTREGKRTFVSTVFPVRDLNDAVSTIGVISLDVSELRAAEKEREQLGTVLRRVTEAVPLCLSYIDADNRYVWTNARNGERLGHDPEWIVGRTAREAYGRQFQEISDTAILVRQRNSVREERAWRGADGEVRDYEHLLVPDLGPDGSYRGHTAMWLDITERKGAQQREHEYAERLQVLSRRLLDAQEAERRAVARELHDGVGQQLTAVLFMLRSLHGAAAASDAAARLDEGAELVNSAINDVRSTSQRLRPAILDDLGLVPALRWLVEQQSRLTGTEMTLELGELSSDVPPRTATCCFRIIQEAITNAARHAPSSRVRVRLEESAGQIELEVEDDGAGFDLTAARKRASEGGSSGLTGMRERAELLGGTCWVHARPGAGTKIRAALPLAA